MARPPAPRPRPSHAHASSTSTHPFASASDWDYFDRMSSRSSDLRDLARDASATAHYILSWFGLALALTLLAIGGLKLAPPYAILGLGIAAAALINRVLARGILTERRFVIALALVYSALWAVLLFMVPPVDDAADTRVMLRTLGATNVLGVLLMAWLLLPRRKADRDEA